MKRDKFQYLRERAEQLIENQTFSHDSDTSKDLEQVLHELHLFQTELELQNRELLSTNTELDLAKRNYYDLYNNAPVGYIKLSQEIDIKEINLRGSTILGGSINNISGTSFFKYIAPEYQDEFHFYLQNLLNSDSYQNCEIKLKSLDGKIIDVLLEGSLVKKDGAEISYLSIAIIDITKWKKTEISLQQSDSLFDFVKALPHPVIAHINGRIIFINEKGLDIFGFEKNEIINEHLFSFVDDRDKHKVKKITKEDTDKILEPIDLRLITKFETIKTKCHISYIHKNITAGQIIIFEDINIIEKLNNQLTLMQNTFDNVECPVILFDNNMKFIFQNQSAYDVYGFNESDYNVSNGIFTIIQSKELVEDIKKILLEGKSWSGTTQALRKKDDPIELSLKYSQVTHGNNLIGYTLMAKL